MSGRPINEDRQIAIELGLKTYIGSNHVACGTSVRYVAGGGCVHCGRLIATKQREALRIAEGRATPKQPLDTPAQSGLDDARRRARAEAAARVEADIDELM